MAFRFVDWLLRLPEGLRTSFAQEMRTFEEEQQMTYITSIEEIGIEKGRIAGRIEGRIAGMIEGIAVMLDLKFGDAAQSVIAEIQSITDLDTLERLIRHIKPAQTLDEIRHIYAHDQQ